MTKNAQSEMLAEVLSQLVDEYLAELQNGAEPDISTYTKRYPQFAEKIAATLKMLHTLEDLSTDDFEQANANETPRKIGEHEIIREIGRGGMGIVYEAYQANVDRHVALKVLPFAALADSSRLQRFKNEVRAAGSLHHANIVPVYSVGMEQGFHYFAMQFIDGMSLAEVIAQWKEFENPTDTASPEQEQPSTELPQSAGPGVGEALAQNNGATTRSEFQAKISTMQSSSPKELQRTIASWGIQVADALSLAHNNGVLHRDIKPANLLLDGDKKVWIADFGLARIEQDATLTLTGDLLGTLRYMAPEQLLAKSGIIDHRADIYSLGATLYELACLRPAFNSTERQKLLDQIVNSEPLSPRELNPRLSPDLETIILRCLEKEPSERFHSAEELRDELQRFFEQRPIQSKPSGIREHIVKGFRRHPALTATASAAMMVLLIISTGFMVALTNQQRVAEHQRNLARDERDDADRQRRMVAIERDRAEQERDRANNALQLAMTTLDEFFGEIGQQWIDEDRTLSDFQLKMLNRSAELLPIIAENYPRNKDYDWAAGLAHKSAGNSLMRVNKFAEAEVQYIASKQLLTDALNREYEVKKVRHELALLEYQLGRVAMYQGRYATGQQKFAEAKRQYREMASDYAEDPMLNPLFIVKAVKCEFEELSLASNQLQDGKLLDRVDELIAEIAPIRKISEYKYPEFNVLRVRLMQLKGTLLRRLGRLQEASEACNVGTASFYLSEELDLRESRRALAALRLEAALIQIELGETGAALENLQEALREVRESFVFDGTPKEMYLSAMQQGQGTHLAEPKAYTLYARIQSRLAVLKSLAGQTDETKELMFESTSTCGYEFMATGNAVSEYACDLLFCAEAYSAIHPLADPDHLQKLDDCINSMRAVENMSGLSPLHRSGLSMIVATKGMYWRAQKRHQNALELFQQSLAMQENVREVVGNHPLVEMRLTIIREMLHKQQQLTDRFSKSQVTELEFVGSYLTEEQRQDLFEPRSLSLEDSDGDGVADHLFVVNGRDKKIVRYEAATGNGGEVFVPSKSGGLTGTYSATYGPDENLYVTDIAARQVMRFDGRTGQALGTVSAPPNKPATYIKAASGGLQSPRYVAFSAVGDMFISSQGKADGVRLAEIIRFHGPRTQKAGQPTGKLVGPDSGLMSPMYLAFGPDGRLYVADGQTHSIHRFDGETGEPLPAPGRSNADFVPSGLGGLNSPYTFRFHNATGDERPELLVTSSTSEILCFDSNTGDFLGVYASFDGSPVDIEILPNGDILIAVSSSNQKPGDLLRFRQRSGE